MQQLDSVTGFSELKDLLIRTYNIEKERSLIQLHFTESDHELLMHDYSDHEKVICLCSDLRVGTPDKSLSPRAKRIVNEALKQNKPCEFLNNGFKLYGFFRS
jgi:hypothetical protein